MTTSDSPPPVERALETVPDLEAGRRLLGLQEGTPAAEIRAALQEHYRPKTTLADAHVFIKPVLNKFAVIGFIGGVAHMLAERVVQGRAHIRGAP